jgi:hypothetical protein
MWASWDIKRRASKGQGGGVKNQLKLTSRTAFETQDSHLKFEQREHSRSFTADKRDSPRECELFFYYSYSVPSSSSSLPGWMFAI